MTNDPSAGRGRLWTDPREAEEHQPWLEPKRRIGPVPPPLRPDDHEPDGRETRAAVRRGRIVSVLIGTAIAALLVGAGVLGANLLTDDAPTGSPAALPVVPGAAPADQRSRSIRTIYARAKESVVPVRVRGVATAGSGTGFVIDKGGVIVTNAHVVDDAQQVQVRLKDNGRYVDADVLGTDVSSDLAVLRVNSSDAGKLRPLALADSDKVQVGDQTLAIGYPLGLNRSASASAGIVSGLGRSIDAANNFSIEKVIQTDAAINPGNSGGPLLDAQGRVIGVNAQIADGNTGGSVGVGFAVPVDKLQEVIPRLRKDGSIERAYLGVATRTVDNSLESLDLPVSDGALVQTIQPGSPAAKAGLRPSRRTATIAGQQVRVGGDIIRAIDGKRVKTNSDVSNAINGKRPGDRVTITYLRGDDERKAEVLLAKRP